MGPLKGVRIVEFDGIGPVPLCGLLLADMGADVIRIARAGGNTGYDDLGETILHRSRTSVLLDLKSEADRKAALDLIAEADILIEGFRPGVMERLGLGPEACLARSPRLIYGRMTGWGQDGPLAPRAGHDINYIALSGALAAIGEEGRPPVPPLNLVGDYGAGTMFLATGVLAALLEARASGKGQVIDVAMTDGVPLFLSLFRALMQNGNWTEDSKTNLLDGGAPFYRTYECADGKFIAVGPLEPQFYGQLLDGLSLERARFPQYDKSLWPQTQAAFAERFRTKTRDEWNAVFADTDACVAPILTMAEAPSHPHAVARAAYVEQGGMVQPAPAPRFSRTKSEVTEPRQASAAQVLEHWSRHG